MTLIGILGALLLERALSHWSYWRTHDLTGHWLAMIRQHSPSAWFWQSRWGLAVLLLPPMLLVWAVLHYLVEPLGPLIELLVGVVVLLACLGPRDMAEEINAFQAAQAAGDDEVAAEIRRDLLRGPSRANGDGEGRSLVAAAFVQGHERWFGVVLFFFVAGPLGALLYCLTASIPAQLRDLSVEGELLETTDAWHAMSAWLPARATILCYALAGSTEDALAAWKSWRIEYAGPVWSGAWSLLGTVGIGAIAQDPDDDEPQCLQAALGVLNRGLMILLAVLALFTLGGWLA